MHRSSQVLPFDVGIYATPDKPGIWGWGTKKIGGISGGIVAETPTKPPKCQISKILILLSFNGISHVLIVFDLVKVHVAVHLGALLVDDADVGVVFRHGRDLAQFGADRGQFG